MNPTRRTRINRAKSSLRRCTLRPTTPPPIYAQLFIAIIVARYGFNNSTCELLPPRGDSWMTSDSWRVGVETLIGTRCSFGLSLPTCIIDVGREPGYFGYTNNVTIFFFGKTLLSSLKMTIYKFAVVQFQLERMKIMNGNWKIVCIVYRVSNFVWFFWEYALEKSVKEAKRSFWVFRKEFECRYLSRLWCFVFRSR